MSSTAALINAPLEERVSQLLSQMTLDEKIGQLNQVHAFGEHEKNAVRNGQIGSIINATSAFAGLGNSPSASAEMCNAIQQVASEESRLHIPIIFGRDVIHGYRTVFPIPLGQAASWNPELVELASAVSAAEASADGIKWTFAPMLDIARDPRWGRVAEGFGEDPFLASTLASAAVKGFQGSDLSASHKIVACGKHFVGYGAAEGGRDYESAEISMRTLRDIYLPPFKAAVDAGVGTIMAAFHDLNSIPLTANYELLTDILRHEWSFKGFVVSDWCSIAELVNHGIVANEAEAAFAALSAGVDMDMVSGVYLKFLQDWLPSGFLSQEIVDEAVRRILRIKFLAGLFEKPYTDTRRASQMILSMQNRNAAHILAQQSIVLLKNEDGILPFHSGLKRILFAGPMIEATGELYGTWTPDGRSEDTQSIAFTAKELMPKDFQISFATSIDDAVRRSALADVVVLCVGEHPSRSGENSNVSHLDLPPGQSEFIQSVANQGVPIVLVVIAGRPLALPREFNLAKAVLYAWHPGIEGANALLDLLLGKANPSAKLPITFPRTTGQVPIYYNHKNSGRPSGTSIFPVRYVDLQNGPLYPFGYGLSYTNFDYTNLQLSEATMTGVLEVSADVTNSGSRTGAEVVQFYIRDLVASVARPVKELKGFQRISLRPGQTHRVTFKIFPADLSFTGRDHLPRLEGGDYNVWIGPDSATGLKGSFTFDI